MKKIEQKNSFLFPYNSEFIHRGKMGVGRQAAWQT